VKLLLYSHFFAPCIGGVETIVMSLARGLAELRVANGAPEFDITLVTQTPRGAFDDAALPFIVVRQPGFRKLLTLIRESGVVHVAGPALSPVALGLLARKSVVIEHHGFQVICPTGQLLIESRNEPCPGHFMAGRPKECWNCDTNLGWFGSRKLWLLTFVRRWLCKRVASNIMPTNWLGKQLSLPRATTVLHGLTQIQAARAPSSHSPNVPTIAFQGRLVTTKGAGLLLEAAKILCAEGHHFRMVFIGDGPERGKLEVIASQPPLFGKVQFTGRVSAAELERTLGDASMVVVPSLGGEVFGLVVAENMRRGLPVIASDLGAFVEVLAEAGKTFPVGNVRELAERIATLLKSPELAASLGAQAALRAEREFLLEGMIAAHAKVYRQVAS
jgi:glycosyltransferase involved in cell wall biosynthesis